jgi:hypothetical protein
MQTWKTSSHKPLTTLILLTILALAINGCVRTPSPVIAPETPVVAAEQPTNDPQVAKPSQTTLAGQPVSPCGITISEIQGAGHVSPLVNQEVTNVHGMVTVRRANGFYMQSITPDDDPATSEGIYVYQGLVPSVRPGDEVLVSAVVKERVFDGDPVNDLLITHLSYPTVEILSRANPLPVPTIIGQAGRMPHTEVIDATTQGRVMADGPFDPNESGLDFYESLEGMLVQINAAVVVGPTNQYKEIVILPDHGAWANLRTPRSGIVVREGDFNPERVILDDALRELPLVQVGDFFPQPIIGVMDYTYGNYKLQPIEDVALLSGGLQPSDRLVPAQPDQVRVATYNVAVLSAQDNSGQARDRIATLAEHIVHWMAAPDIIGLQEVADNDGLGSAAISADLTYQAVIDAILALGGPPYGYLDLDPLPNQDGGAPDANIRVGFLYRLDRGLRLVEAPHGDSETPVSVTDQDGIPTLSLNPGRIDPANRAFTSSRKPLVAAFLLDGEPLFVINNHFNSKGGDHSLFGAVQPPLLTSEGQRVQQARVVHDFVTSILAINPASRVIVLGDLNDFHFSEPVQVLKGELLHNLIETLPIDARYTYIYDGNSQVLDHILVSQPLSEALVSLDILHLNSEFDYWQQFSDHDPVVATFSWE